MTLGVCRGLIVKLVKREEIKERPINKGPLNIAVRQWALLVRRIQTHPVEGGGAIGGHLPATSKRVPFHTGHVCMCVWAKIRTHPIGVDMEFQIEEHSYRIAH